MSKKKTQFEPEISGTLDIGGGDRPYSDATVVADINIPTKPKAKPYRKKGKGKVR